MLELFFQQVLGASVCVHSHMLFFFSQSSAAFSVFLQILAYKRCSKRGLLVLLVSDLILIAVRSTGV